MTKTETTSDLKLNFIHLITQISDYQQLKSLYALVQSQLRLSATPERAVDKFELGKLEIRSGCYQRPNFRRTRQETHYFSRSTNDSGQ